jgi:hypothetical protein
MPSGRPAIIEGYDARKSDPEGSELAESVGTRNNSEPDGGQKVSFRDRQSEMVRSANPDRNLGTISFALHRDLRYSVTYDTAFCLSAADRFR